MTARPGFVLLYALLVVLTGAALTGGMLVLAGREAVIARRYVDIARARAAAEGEARNTFQSWSTRRFADLLPGQDRSIPGSLGNTLVTVTRLDTTLFAITVAATVPAGAGPAATARAGMLVRTLRPLEADRFAPPVAASERVTLVGGRVSGRDLCMEAPPGPGVIAPDVDAMGAQVDGDPPVLLATPPATPPGSALDPAILSLLADIRLVDPVATPRPRTMGGICEPGPSNWGAIQEGHPCGSLRSVIHAPGDLTVQGGEGRGVLVVHGDLVLEGSFRFDGVVVATGEVLIRPGVHIRGAVLGRLIRIEDAEVLRDHCLLEQALGAPILDRAYRPGDRWWIPIL